MDSMEKMCEGPDIRSLAEVHPLISALLFLTCFFSTFFSCVHTYSQNFWKCHSSKIKAGEFEYLTTASIDLSCMVAVSLQCRESNNQFCREDAFFSPNPRVQLSHPKQIHRCVVPVTELEGGSFTWLLVHQYSHLKHKIFIDSSWVFSCWCSLSSYMFCGFVSFLLIPAFWQLIISFLVSAVSHPCGYLSLLPKTAEL